MAVIKVSQNEDLLVRELIDHGCRRFIFATQGNPRRINRIRIGDVIAGSQEFSRILSDPSLDFHMSPPYHNISIADIIRECINYYRIEGEILVVMGDRVIDLPLRELLEVHRRQGAQLTAVLWEAQEFRESGITRLDDDDRTRIPIEKLSVREIPSQLVNTGVYLLSPEMRDSFDHPTGTEDLDMSDHMIPFPIKETDRVFGWNLSQCESSYWSDVDTPHRYRQTAWEILHGRLQYLHWNPPANPESSCHRPLSDRTHRV